MWRCQVQDWGPSVQYENIVHWQGPSRSWGCTLLTPILTLQMEGVSCTARSAHIDRAGSPLQSKPRTMRRWSSGWQTARPGRSEWSPWARRHPPPPALHPPLPPRPGCRPCAPGSWIGPRPIRPCNPSLMFTRGRASKQSLLSLRVVIAVMNMSADAGDFACSIQYFLVIA